jgi:hypothetical protein
MPPTTTTGSTMPQAVDPNDPTVGQRSIVSDNLVNDPTKQTASNVGPVTGAIDSPTMTVQGQLESILAKDSPLMDQARAKAMREANNRGLVNSSMAAQAGEEAMISQALPIAQQDAGEYFAQGRANQDAGNLFAGKTADFQNTSRASPTSTSRPRAPVRPRPRTRSSRRTSSSTRTRTRCSSATTR